MVLPGPGVHLYRLLIGPVVGATCLVLPRTAGKLDFSTQVKKVSLENGSIYTCFESFQYTDGTWRAFLVNADWSDLPSLTLYKLSYWLTQ